MYVCICNAVTERQVQECAQAGVCSVDELALELGVGAGCGRCRDCAEDIIRCAQNERLAAASPE